MKKYFLITLLMLLSVVSCVNTQTKNIAQNAVPQPTPEVQTSPAQSISNLRTEKLDFAKVEKIKFADLPPEIIAHLAKYENKAEYVDKAGELQSYPDNSPEWYKGRKVEVLAKDLNNDDIMEKIVVCDDSADYDVAPTAYFFTMKNKRWISLHSDGFGSPKMLELLSAGKKGEFDIIGYGGERTDTDGKKIKFTGYWHVKNEQYERFECREVKDATEKIVPCVK